MPRVGIGHLPVARVQFGVEHRQEHIRLAIFLDVAVGPREHVGRGAAAQSQVANGRAAEGHEERGGHAAVGYVGHNKAPSARLARQWEEVVEVATHQARRLEVGGELPAGQARRLGRQHAALNLAADGQLLFDTLPLHLFLVQPGFLDSQRRLIGHQPQQAHLTLVEPPRLARVDHQRADGLTGGHQRHDGRGPEALARQPLRRP